MREHLRLAAFPYDFNSDRLSILAGRQFDWICCRYAIGFCERLDDFFADLGLVASPGGYVYMSFSPPSLGVCSRWMFDDYTYLRQYTLDTVLVAALKAGFDVVRVFDDGSYRYDHGLHWVQKLVTEVYRKLISRSLTSGSDYYRLWQHNVAVLLRRGPKDGDHVLPMPSSFPHL
ncbi:MAG TPA: hypothetical protein VNM92_15215 [Thermoanaerobaculia bacterium]|nr:hypothetical protein [Thermoanaerobaculia bacterium]